MTLLVTGCAGFIGSNFVHTWLGSSDEQVINLDKLTYAGNLANLASLKDDPRHVFVQGDIGDTSLVPQLLVKYKPRAVLNFAAESHVDRSIHGPADFIQTNIVGTVSLLEILKFHKSLRKFVYASSSCVYGTATQMNEDTFIYPSETPYSINKYTAELYTQYYAHLFHVPTVSIRIFNTYGPRMRLDDGRVLPAFIGQALRGEDLTAFGDGSQTRSFCYVSDLVEGIYKLLMSDYAQPVNVGNPDEITINQFGEEILKLTGAKSKLIYKPLPIDDPKQRRPDITKAKTILGWEPKVNRAEGLKLTLSYFQSLIN